MTGPTRAAAIGEGGIDVPRQAPRTLASAEGDVRDLDADEWLRKAVEALPDHERLVVALHYLGEQRQSDVAAFLGLPLSTVKKRLFSARKRLKEGTRQMETHAPSKTPRFADRIQLFLELRAGDAAAVAAILDRDPGLLQSEEGWSIAEALDGRLPAARRVTPLEIAASSGDVDLVTLLLERGASTEGQTHDGRPTPLWRAVQNGRLEAVRRLLEAGASPNAVNAVGHSALHVAAMRHREDLVELLVRHGSNRSLVARNGRTAADYAREPRLAAVLHPDGEIETGIAAVDFFAPLRKGHLVRVRGAAGTGLVVLMSELTRRLSDGLGRSVWLGWEPTPWQHGELAAATHEMGVDDCTTVVRWMDLAAIHAAAPFALFVFQVEGRSAEVEAALLELVGSSGIVFIVEPWSTVTRKQRPIELRAPFHALISTSPAMAQRGVWPAIDVHQTSSDAPVSDEHRRLRDEIRAIPSSDNGRAAAVEGFFAQPFAICQHERSEIARFIRLEETLAGLAANRKP